MKAHLSPSHIHSRKCLHFFLGIANWSCSPQSSFLFPISPSSHGASPYGSVVSACVCMNLHIWCHSIVGLKHTSLSTYLPLHCFVYITLIRQGCSGRKWEPSTLPTHWAAALSTGWCTKTSHTARPAHFQLTALYFYSFIRGGLGGQGNIQTGCQSLKNNITPEKLNTSSQTAIKRHTSYWVSNSEPSVTFIIALRSTSLLTVLVDIGNNYCHQFHEEIRWMAAVFI